MACLHMNNVGRSFFVKKFQKMTFNKLKNIFNFLFCETRYSVLDEVRRRSISV